MIETPVFHILGDTNIMSQERSKIDAKEQDFYNDVSVNHTSVFKSTSPIT